jgi:hypothetical protein
MNADEYKKICSQPNAFPRSILESTQRTLMQEDSPVALKLSDVLQNSPITKPDNHKGNKFSEHFLITLSESEVEVIIDVFIDLEVANVGVDGKSTSLSNFYAGIADKWTNYLTSLNS